MKGERSQIARFTFHGHHGLFFCFVYLLAKANTDVRYNKPLKIRESEHTACTILKFCFYFFFKYEIGKD